MKGTKRERKFLQKKGKLDNTLKKRRDHKAKAKIRQRRDEHTQKVARREADSQTAVAAAEAATASSIAAATGDSSVLRPAGVSLDEFLACPWLTFGTTGATDEQGIPLQEMSANDLRPSLGANADARLGNFCDASAAFGKACVTYCSQPDKRWGSGYGAGSSAAVLASEVVSLCASLLGAAGSKGHSVVAADESEDGEDEENEEAKPNGLPAGEGASGENGASSTTGRSHRPLAGMARQRIEKARKWPLLKAPIRAFLVALLRSLANAAARALAPRSDSKNNKRAALDLTHVLAAVSAAAPLLQPFPELLDECLVALLRLTAACQSLDRPALCAVLATLHQLTEALPPEAFERAMRGAYAAYRAAADAMTPEGEMLAEDAGVAAAKASVGVSWRLSLLRSAIARLYCDDTAIAELHVYVALHDLQRDLLTAQPGALAADALLPGGKSGAGAAALERVRSWGFTQRLWLWVEVVVSGSSGEQRVRAYRAPIAAMLAACGGTVAAGAAGLPQRLAIARMQQTLSRAGPTFVPASQQLIAALRLEMLYRKNAPAGSEDATESPLVVDGVSLDMFGLGRLTKELARSAAVQAAAAAAVLELLQREVDLYRYGVGAPEYLAPLADAVAAAAPRMAEAMPTMRQALRHLGEHIGRVVAEAVKRRALVEEAPGAVPILEMLRRPDDPILSSA